MSDCIFCAIQRKQIPARTIYEDNHVIAFMDISQVTPGHTLIIPKQHVRNIFDYDTELAQHVFSSLPLVSRAVKKHNEQVQGVNIVINNEPVAYQTVFHSHIHVIPRYSSNDAFSISFEDQTDLYTDEALDVIKEKLLHAIEEDAQ